MSLRMLIVSRFLLALLLCLATLSATAADTTELTERRAAAARINQLMHQNQRHDALPLCRQYVAEFPADAVMQYNLACLENTTGEPERAVAAFRAAVAAGFTDFDVAESDPDLLGDNHQVFLSIIAAENDRITALALARGLSLELGVWSAPRDLIPHGADTLVDNAPFSRPQLRLRWHDTGLEFELTADSDWEGLISQATVPPWEGGPGLSVSLGVPDGSSGWDLSNHFLFAFGVETKGGVGGVFVASQNRFQRVLELAPKIRVDEDGRLYLTGTIPWQVIAPYNPIVDTPLGINATVYLEGPDEGRLASLLETRDTLDPTARRRRFARLDFRTDSIRTDMFLGKLGSSLSSDRPLDLQLVAISAEAGTATLSLNFIDQAGRSVLPEGPLRGSITLKAGTNLIDRQADFSSLSTGGYVMLAELTFPSGRTESWGATVLQLAYGWQDQYEERISFVARAEQATARHWLEAIRGSVAEHQSRRSPGAIVTTLIDLDNMLSDAEDSGSILPDKGSFVFVYPGPGGQDRLCRMYLPAGRDIADGVNPIVVLGRGNGDEARLAARLAARIGRNYEHGTQMPTLKPGNDDRFPVYLVPELSSDPTIPQANLQADLQAEVDACRVWAMSYFQAPAVSLVGIDALGGVCLIMAVRAPREVRGLLIFAGRNLDPWPQAQPEFIRRQLSPAPAGLPVTWIDFSGETSKGGQSRSILQALKDLDYRIVAEQEVRGGLNLTQAADRLVLWAESLR